MGNCIGDSRVAQDATEDVDKPADDVQMPHPASAGGLPPLGLDRPVVLPDLSLGVATGSAYFLLDMEGDLTTPAAQGMGLVAPLSKGAGSLGHGDFLASEIQVAMKFRRWKQISRQYK